MLVSNPSKLKHLTAEVRKKFNADSEINSDSTNSLPYLNAVIEEALRLYPPVPFNLQRISPGAVVDGNYVPEGVVVGTTPWATQHSPKYFHDAEKFHPERWLRPEHPLYDGAFAQDNLDASKPFSLGPRMCVGINLAYIEMRLSKSLAFLVFSLVFRLTQYSSIG